MAEASTGAYVKAFTPELVGAKPTIWSALKAVISFDHTVGGLFGDVCAEVSVQAFVVHPQAELKGVVGGVEQLQVAIIEHHRGTASEGQNSMVVRKGIEGVVMPLSDHKFRM